MSDRTRIVSYRLKAKLHRDGHKYYYGVFRRADNKEFERILRFDGRTIKASPGAHIRNRRVIMNEDDLVKADVYSAVIDKKNELDRQGVFKQCSCILNQGIKEYLAWAKKHRRNPKAENELRYVKAKFGDRNLSSISRKDVAEWIAELELKYAHTTIKHAVGGGQKVVNWLIKNEKYEGKNPFYGHEFKGTGNTREVKPIITADEWQVIMNTCKNPRLMQAMVQAYYLGIRDSEIMRIIPSDYNHELLVLTVHTTKDGKRDRLIAIPRALSVWVLNHQDEWYDLNESTVDHEMAAYRQSVSKQYPEFGNLCISSFRKNFAQQMEYLDVNPEYSDAHQGRYESGVRKQHYVRDKMRAVRLMREHVDKYFGGDSNPPDLKIVAK